MSHKLVLLVFCALACSDGGDGVTGLEFDGPTPSAVCSAHNTCGTLDGRWEVTFGVGYQGGRDTLYLTTLIIDEVSPSYTGAIDGGGDLWVNHNPTTFAVSGSRSGGGFTLTFTNDAPFSLTLEGIWENDRAVGLLNGDLPHAASDSSSGPSTFNDFQVTLERTTGPTN
jgi:hypothetical protein